jgi:hypothetical protein
MKNESYSTIDTDGIDCFALNRNSNEPCWGHVLIVDEVDGGQPVFACCGHGVAYDYPYKTLYIAEPRIIDTGKAKVR